MIYSARLHPVDRGGTGEKARGLAKSEDALTAEGSPQKTALNEPLAFAKLPPDARKKLRELAVAD